MHTVGMPEPTADSEPELCQQSWSDSNFIMKPRPTQSLPRCVSQQHHMSSRAYWWSSTEVCEPATSYVVNGILVEFVGLNWMPVHTPTTEVSAVSWVSDDLLYYELDEEVIACLQSLVTACFIHFQVLKVIPGYAYFQVVAG